MRTRTSRLTRVAHILGAAISLFTMACATGGVRPAGARDEPRPASTRSAILGADLADMRDRSLYDALMRVRPAVLQPGSPTELSPNGRYADVYLDNQFVGDVTFLRTYTTNDVRAIEILSRTEAAVRFGRLPSVAAIVVRTR